MEQFESWQTIDSVYLFRNGIHPTWEDPINATGCEYIQSLADVDPENIDQLWQKVATSLVTEEFPHSKALVTILS